LKALQNDTLLISLGSLLHSLLASSKFNEISHLWLLLLLLFLLFLLEMQGPLLNNDYSTYYYYYDYDYNNTY
jgi:hypothetical protein